VAVATTVPLLQQRRDEDAQQDAVSLLLDAVQPVDQRHPHLRADQHGCSRHWPWP
jgi:hypothetical protein